MEKEPVLTKANTTGERLLTPLETKGGEFDLEQVTVGPRSPRSREEPVGRGGSLR